MGEAIKLIGKGLNTGKLFDPILSAEQLATLESTPEMEPFDGDAGNFRLGVEAMRLALAYSISWLMGGGDYASVDAMNYPCGNPRSLSPTNGCLKIIESAPNPETDTEACKSGNQAIQAPCPC